MKKLACLVLVVAVLLGLGAGVAEDAAAKSFSESALEGGILYLVEKFFFAGQLEGRPRGLLWFADGRTI